jgi:hypothetical protein
MKIDIVSGPDVAGMTVQQALQAIARHCHDTAVQVMRISNELEELRSRTERLEQQLAAQR